jgi:ElaB/YqjD/DUF883 family membrane-anchored ribosome-binding protein
MEYRRTAMVRRSTSQKTETEDLHEEIDALKDAVTALAGKVKKTSKQRGNEVLDEAMAHPAKALGIAFGVGLLLGLILKK